MVTLQHKKGGIKNYILCQEGFYILYFIISILYFIFIPGRCIHQLLAPATTRRQSLYIGRSSKSKINTRDTRINQVF